MSSTRAALAAPLAVLVAIWIRLAWVHPLLPARIPAHFGPAGQVDRWSDPGEFVLFNALFPAFVTAVMLGSALLAVRLPARWVNLPNREFWLAPERIEATRARLLAHMATFATLTLLLFAAVMEISLSVARSGSARLPALFFWALGLYLAGMGFVVASLFRTFGRGAVERRRATESTGLRRG